MHILQTGLDIQHNTFVANSNNYLYENYIKENSDVQNFGIMNNNTWVYPSSSNIKFQTFQESPYEENKMTPSQWQAFSGKDATSTFVPVQDGKSVIIKYNKEKIAQSISLGSKTYQDTEGQMYSNSTTLDPFTSIVLIESDAAPNSSPTVSAGTDQTITLPTNSVTLTGTASDSDG